MIFIVNCIVSNKYIVANKQLFNKIVVSNPWEKYKKSANETFFNHFFKMVGRGKKKTARRRKEEEKYAEKIVEVKEEIKAMAKRVKVS